MLFTWKQFQIYRKVAKVKQRVPIYLLPSVPHCHHLISPWFIREETSSGSLITIHYTPVLFEFHQFFYD